MKRRHRPLILPALLCLVLALSACSRAVERELTQIEQYLEAYPDSALVRLASLDSASCSGGRRAALRAYLTSFARYKLHIDEYDNGEISAAADYFRSHGDRLRLMRAQFFNGYALFNAKEYQEAIAALTEAWHLAQEQGDAYFGGLSARQIGSTFGATFSSENYLHYALLAREWFKKGGYKDHANWSLLEIGEAYAHCGNTQKALEAYEEALARAKEADDNYLLGESMRSRAEILVSENKPDEAIRLFTQVLDSLRHPLPSVSYTYYAKAHALKGDYRKALELLNHADTLASTPHETYFVNYNRYQAALIHSDYANAIQSIEKVISYVTGEEFLSINTSALTSQRDYYNELTTLTKLESQLSRLKHLTVIACLVILLLLLAFFIYHHIQRARRREELDREERVKLIRRMENMSARHSSNLKKTSQTGMSFFNALTQLIWQSQPHKVVPELQKILEGLVSDEQIIDHLSGSLNETRNGIMLRLCKQVPSLNAKETLMYCYLASRLDRNTICAVLDKTPGAVNAQVYRLRQKIEDSGAQDREEFLDVIS